MVEAHETMSLSRLGPSRVQKRLVRGWLERESLSWATKEIVSNNVILGIFQS